MPKRRTLDLRGTLADTFDLLQPPHDATDHRSNAGRRRLSRCLDDFERALRISMKGRPLPEAGSPGDRRHRPDWIENC